jgi:hypothetical protein
MKYGQGFLIPLLVSEEKYTLNNCNRCIQLQQLMESQYVIVINNPRRCNSIGLILARLFTMIVIIINI